VKDGTTSEHDWVGIVPTEDRMHVIDPPKGFFVHANNRLGEEDFYGGLMNYTAFTARANRITQLIKAEIKSGRKIGKEFMKKVLYDTVDVYCRSILPEILTVVEESRPILNSFDCNFTSTSYAASFYEVFMFELYQLMKPYHSERMSIITFHQMQQGIFNFIHFAYRGDASKQVTMRKAWPNVLTRLEKHFGTKDHTKWLWGSIHRDTNRHLPFRTHNLLSRIFDREAPGFGNFHTPNVGKMDKL
jgi:acyl-homoserine lactone acylase PvdQ